MNAPSFPTNLELNTEYQTAHRFPAWVALSVFSAICLAAVNSQMTASADAAHKWCLAVTILSLIIAFGGLIMYLIARHMFAGTFLEIGATALLLIFWCAGLPVMMNPNRGIAVDAQGVENANLYFFAWGSLAAVVFLGGSLAQELSGVNVREYYQQSSKVARWYGLCASSVIVMASSVRFYTARDCSNEFLTHDELCKRTKFAISVGVLSFVGSFCTAYVIQSIGMTLLVEFVTCVVFLTLWCFGVGFITFGIAPGALIGNLYFASWISFLLIVFLFAGTFREFMAASSATDSMQNNNGDVVTTTNGGDGEMHDIPTGGSPEVPSEEDI